MADRQLNYEINLNVNKASLSKINSELDKTIKTLNQAITERGLSEEFSKSVEAAKQLKAILNSSWKNNLNQLDLKQVHNQIEGTFGSIQNLKTSLADTSSLGANAYNEFSKAVLNTNLQLSESSKLLDSMADTMAKTIKWGIASRIMNNVASSIEKAWNYSVKLDSSLNDIRIVTGKGADEMERFAVTANKAAKSLGASTRDYTEASLIYYQQGLSDQESQRRAEITLKAANVTGQAAQEVSEQLTAVWNGYNVTLDETELYVDKLAAVAANTAADLEELSTGMSKVASAASTMGVDIDQLNAQMATIVSVTRQAPESVGVALKTIYARMGDIEAGLDEETTLGNYTSKMAQLGVNVLDASGKLREMGDVIEEIGNKWTDLTKEQRVALAETMAGTRQYNNLLTLFNNWDMYKKALETSATAAGTLQKQQDIYMESTEAHLQQMRTEAERTYDILFDTKTVNSFIDAFTGLNSVFNTFLKGLGGGMNDFVYFGSLLTNIFSNQLATGINNTIQNFNKFIDNKDKIALMQDIVNAGPAEGGTLVTKNTQADLNMAKNILSIQRNISNEEFNELNTLRQKITITNEILAKIDKEDKITEETIENAEKELRLIQQQADTFSNLYLEEQKSGEDLQARYEISKNILDLLYDEIGAQKILNELETAHANGDEETQNKIFRQAEILITNKRKNKAKEIEVLTKNLGKGKEEIKEFGNEAQEAFDKKFNTDKTNAKISTIIAGVSVLTQSLTALSGIVKTLGDDSLSSGEKLSQVLTSLGAIATTVAFNWNNLKDFIPMLMTFLTSPTTLMVAGIVAAVAAIAALINEISLLTNRERVLNRELEQNKKAVEESKKAYEELKDTISSYQDAYKSIEKLTEGTVEFYEAVLKSNEEAKKLIKTLDLKAGSQYQIDSNGLIQINEDTIQQELYKKNQEWAKAQLNQSLTEFTIKDRKNQQEIERLTKQFQNSVSVKIPGNNYGISYEQAQQMIDNFNLDNNDLTISIGELKETTNKNLKSFQSEIGIFNQQEISKIEDNFGDMSVLITGEMADVIDAIKANQAEDRASYRLIGSEAINAYASEEQKEALKDLPAEVKNILNDTAGEQIIRSQTERENMGLGGRNITNTFEQGLGLWASTPLADITSRISPIDAILNKIGDKILEEQQNYNETQAQNQETIEKRLTEWTTSTQQYLQQASNAGYAGNAGGQYIASAQFEAKTFGNVQQSTLDMMTVPELQFALENSKELQQSLLGTNETIDEYIKKVQEAQGPLDQWGRNQERVATDLENYNNLLKSTAEELETTTKAMQLYGDAANNANKTNGKLDATTAEQIKGLAKFNKAYNEAIELYEDNEDALKDYAEAMENHTLMSFEAAEGAAEVAEKLEEMGLSLNGKQLADNLDKINILLSGTEEEAGQAYNELLSISRLNFLEGYESFFDGIENGIQGFVDYLSGVQPGTVIEQNYANALTNMINASHMTADEIYKTLNALHLQGPNMDVQLEKKHELIHGAYTQVIKYDAEIPIMSGFGKEPTTKRMTFRIFKDVPAEYADYYTLGEGQTFETSGAPNFSRSPSNAGGSGGRSGGGGGGSSKQPSKIDPVEKEKDRYHDVNIQLKQISNELDKLDKQKDKLFGNDLIENLNKQLELLNKQIDTTNEKMKIAEGEAQELQGKLAASGVTFNADGTISNYAQAYQAQLNYVNGIINQYNSMGAEAQEGFKDTVENAKDNFEKFVENINRYDEVITDVIPGLAADVQEAIDKQIDIKIEEFDMEIELRLDLAEAERDWNNFKKKIIDGIEDDDILGNAMARLVDFSSYYKEDETGAAQALRKQIDNTLKELYQMDETGSSNVYGDNRTAALEDLKKYYDELMSQMEDILKLQEEIHQSYIDMMNEAQDKFDEQIKAYGIVNDLIEHDAKVISLVYGEEAYHQLSNFYDKQQANFKAEMDFQRQQVEFWKDQMDAVEAGTEAWDEAKEKWTAAAEELNDIIENSIENLQDKYLNAINAIFQDLNNKVTSGAGLGYIEEEWNLINKNADQYLDNINRLYGIQNLENKYLDAINDTNNIAAQKQLKKIMDEEIKNLQERDRLTEYDIERANKKYEITLKQIALEEAQQNKTQLRLRRDTQGNYRYEFISDIDQVNQLQNDLDDLYNSLYNFDKENYADNLNQLYDVWNEFQEKMAEAAQINDPQARAEKELLIQEQYGELINGLVEQNETIRGNLYDSAFEDLARLYDEDKNNFLEMTQAEQDAIMNDLIPYWDAGVQHMADVFAGEGGFVPTCEEAIDELHEATKEYEDGLKELEDTANISFDDIGNGIDDVINQTQELLANNDELINSYREEMDAIGGVVNELDNLVNKYQESADAAKAAEKAAYDYWSEQQRQAAEAAARDQAEKAKKAAEEAAKKAAQTPKPTPAPAPIPAAPNGGDGVPRVGDVVDYISGIYHADSYGGGASGSMNLGGKVQITIVKDDGRPYPIHIATLGGGPLGWLAKHQISGYDTGGYTGEWNNNGRLALLHQKELVLNQQDTRNLLNAVNVMRSITSAVGSRVLERLSMASSNGAFNGGNSGILDQNVHIEANFPNATNHAEIEEALNNLVNAAAQRAQTKER